MDAVDDTAAQLAGPEPELKCSASFLAVLLDLHADNWVNNSSYTLWQVLSNALVFMNAHLALDSENELVVIGYNGAGVKILHSTADKLDPADTNSCADTVSADTPQIEGAMIRQFRNIDQVVMKAVHEYIRVASSPKNQNSRTSVAGPLSLALTYLQRHMNSTSLDGHICVISASPETEEFRYVTAMNAIFTAQKMGIPIDCATFGPPITYLQQAADFTKGAYLEIKSDPSAPDESSIIPIFMSVFLVEPSVRPHVNLATKPDIDFSAICFVTKQVVEIGMVCSVCLCIMKEVVAGQCPVCHTSFEIKDNKLV